jgi:hypothetical protein
MTTKRPSVCKIATGRKPTAKQYQTAAVAVTSPVPIMQPPHTMPPWGGPCFLQSYREAMAYQKAAQAAAAYLQAVVEYNAAWQAMEDCKNGLPA